MSTTFELAGKQLTDSCARDLYVYKKAVKTITSQATRKLVESIIAQKVDQLSDLKAATLAYEDAGSTINTGPETEAETWPDPESLLKEIAEKENAFAMAIRTIAPEAATEESRSSLFASAERSRKFASWCQDHIDLLALL